MMDGAKLEVLWSNLISIVSEQAKVLQRTAFSSIVRDAGDLAVAIFDPAGRMVAQAETGTPGHINSLAICGDHLIRRFPAATLADGDVLITNDPWLGAGHFFDITTLTPIYRGENIVAYLGSTIHHTDMGGYGHGAGARDVYQEGLWIPPLKLYDKGVLEPVLSAMIQQNVRMPTQVMGDLAAQVSSARVAGERLMALMDRHSLDTLMPLSDEIVLRSDRAMREAIRQLPAGTYHGVSEFDVPGGATITLKAALTVDTAAGDILIDFAGSSPQCAAGINVCMNYTHAYATFAIRACLAPQLPNNHGSLAPIRVVAPKRSILNCEAPAPVNARHVVGMYVPMPIIKALHQAAPERVLAESSGASWTFHVYGKRLDGQNFIQFWGSSGGMGARAGKAGLDATKFPTGVSAQQIELVEAGSPVVFLRKELRRGSGGAGRHRGGDGQIIRFRVRTAEPWVFDAVTSRMNQDPEGLAGGGPGARGVFTVNGRELPSSALLHKMDMASDDVVEALTPGGGGYGAPE